MDTICGRIAIEFPGLAERMREREAVGLARYGRPLDPEDGRDWIAEAREELADAMVYLTAGSHLLSQAEQSDDALRKWVAIRRARRVIAEVLDELGR